MNAGGAEIITWDWADPGSFPGEFTKILKAGSLTPVNIIKE